MLECQLNVPTYTENYNFNNYLKEENDTIEEWKYQYRNQVNTLEKLEKYINITDEEHEAIIHTTAKWGTTPYFASLMDRNDPNCPIRKQVVPSKYEQENKYGIEDYLIFKENRSGEEERPDTIARQYQNRVAFTVVNACGIYCRHCFRKELVVDESLELRFDIDEGLEWISEHNEIREVLVTGGDPLLLPDDRIEYVIRKLREIPHIEMIRFGSRLPVVLPHRVTPGLRKVLGEYHRVPIWLNTQCNHAKEITNELAKAVWDLLTCGINVGNQAVLIKGINDDVESFKQLHESLLNIRIRPYYVFYLEAAPGIDHLRTPIEKGAELIRDALRGHTSGLAQPMYVIATNIGKIPLMPDYYIKDKNEKEYILQNHRGEVTSLPTIH
ncbi:Lysine 2,3-aminomutase [Candidatus Syntrophocurvum alkaliphilum]|uniref:Lysine 2,3-aminomutase n=1 Tax=Candidatus Syntrophocurvum alkaliphilum TaxID=2293317 RepID=A0A6I6DI56_9FIRM|nr:KamA family radical SAM protein [Candidatus Syntrophocurvum alkaliphilum]QGT99923.1 Lysine 2,3-aminomutase [Candidatus Syntrophocurvum alkaliphilum]